MTTPRAAAERVIDELGIASIEDLSSIEDVAWARGAVVHEARLTGAEARILIRGQRGQITVSTDIPDARRRRFSIAHELGHLEMHKFLSSVSLCLAVDIESWNGKAAAPHEIEANEFASCILMPERWFAPDCQATTPSLDLVASLADKYSTSLTATARRYAAFSDDAVAVVFSRDGFVRWFHGSQDFMDGGLFIDPKTRLSGQTFAGGYFKGTPPPAEPRLVLAENWLRLRNATPHATIIEHSRPMPSYNAVLSLLWVKGDIVNDDDFDPDED